MNRETKVGVSVIIIDKYNRVLVGKRKGSHGAGLLSVPGGHVEFNESFNTTCDRELMEEIGVNFPNRYVKHGFSEDFFKTDNGIKHYVTLYFVVTGVNSDTIEIKNMEPEKCEGWEWVDINALPDVMFCDTKNMLDEINMWL